MSRIQSTGNESKLSVQQPTVFVWQRNGVEPTEFIDWLKGYSRNYGGGGQPSYLRTIQTTEAKLTRPLNADELKLLYEISMTFSAGGDGGPSQSALQELTAIQEHFRKQIPS